MREHLTPRAKKMREEIISLEVPENIATMIAESSSWGEIMKWLAEEFNLPFDIIIDNELTKPKEAEKIANRIIYYALFTKHREKPWEETRNENRRGV